MHEVTDLLPRTARVRVSIVDASTSHGMVVLQHTGRPALGRTPPVRLLAADPPPALPTEGNTSAARSLALGESASLDELGPVVVTENGQLRYIDNWGEMSETEREATQRIIARRNAARLKKLRGGGSAGLQHGSFLPASLPKQLRPMSAGSELARVAEVSSASQLSWSGTSYGCGCVQPCFVDVPARAAGVALTWLPAAATAVQTSDGPRMGDFSGSPLDVVVNNFLIESIALSIPALGILAIAVASWQNPKKSSDPSYFRRRSKRGS